MSADHQGPNPLGDKVLELGRTASSALDGLAEEVGLTAQVAKNPYGTLAAALGVGYVLGGGLFTPTTARLLRLAFKLAAVPAVQGRLLDVAEAALDQVLAQGKPRAG